LALCIVFDQVLYDNNGSKNAWDIWLLNLKLLEYFRIYIVSMLQFY
jgi:hypothetical protein